MSHKQTNKEIPNRLKEYRRAMLRSALVSLFWSVIEEKKKAGFKLQMLADMLGAHKSTVSRWFSPDMPNWETDTIADIAGALNLELEIKARDKESGAEFTPTGRVTTKVLMLRAGQWSFAHSDSTTPLQPALEEQVA